MSTHQLLRCSRLCALLAIAALTASPAHAVLRTWLSAASGSAGTSTLWTPNGIPAAGDNVVVSPAGVYTISFPVASVPLVISHDYRNGAIVTLTSDGVHSTTSSFGIGQLSSAAVNLLGGSTFKPATFFMGNSSTSYGRLTMTSSGIPSLSPVFQQADSNNGSIIGGSGKARLEVVGGGTFLADGYAIFGNGTTAVCTLIVSGRNAVILTNSSFQTTNPRKGNLLFGNVGNAFGRVDNGAFMRIKGDITMGAGVNGRAAMRVGTSTSIFNPSFYAEKTLRIADTGFPGGQGGGAEFWLSRGFAGIGGLCTLGDPDGNTALPVLRVDGGTLRMSGGFTRNSGSTLEHLGGTIHFPDGQITWPGFDWNVTSTAGTPLLWFANSRVTNNVTHMNVGRSGAGALRVTQPGTQVLLSGSLTVGDSTGGSGTVELDSSASVSSFSPLTIGRAGTGAASVSGGATLTTTQLDIATQAGSNGTLTLRGPDSRVAFTQLQLGGELSSSGGPGRMEVDSFAVADGDGSGLSRIFDGTGHLVVRRGGVFRTGQLACGHRIDIDAGTIQAPQTLLFPATLLVGRGTMIGDVTLEGAATLRMLPGTFGRLAVQGPLSHFGTTRVGLGRPGGTPKSDTLAVSQLATLFGTLQLEQDSTFQRIVGDTFVVATWGTRSGAFEAITWYGIAASDSFDVVYQSNRLLIITKPTTLGADPVTPQPRELALRVLGGRSAALAFSLELPSDAEVRVTLHDVTGRTVARMHEGTMTAGAHRLEAGDHALPGGVYFARAAVTRGGRTEVRTVKAVRLR